MTAQLRRRTFTVEEYERMGQAGILSEDDRVELLAGEIVEMAPIGSRHAACVDRLVWLFSQRLGGRAVVRVQNPIRLGEHSEPQPDLALVRPRRDFYSGAHPGPADVFLVIEVAETSAEVDRQVKVPLYAQAGVPEVWLADLAARSIDVHTGPTPQGYQKVAHVRSGHSLSPEAFPDVKLDASEILLFQ